MSDHAEADENQRKRESVVHPALDIEKMFQASRDFFRPIMAAAKTGSVGLRIAPTSKASIQIRPDRK
jgi:hypothetical protein